MSPKLARSTSKLRKRLTHEGWHVYQQGLKSLADEAATILTRAVNALDAVRREADSFSEMCSYGEEVSDKQLRAALKSLKEKLYEVDMIEDCIGLVQRFYFEGDDYAALTPLGKFAVELERAAGVSKVLERRCNSLMDGFIPALS